jgi:hypothetical protein
LAPPAYVHGLPNHWNHQIAGIAGWQAIQYLAGMPSIFVRNTPKASLRREPKPKAIGHNGDGPDAAEPKRYEPQQALRQRPRFLLLGHQ